MKSNSQLSGVLHVLMHMALREGPTTSESLARAMQTNPVVVRRLMGGLRKAGFVASAKGHGGGWVVTCPLDTTTVGDIHQALGAPHLLAVGHRDENPDCVIEQAVNTALDAAYRDAERLVLERLHGISLADLYRLFQQRMATDPRARKYIHHEQ